VIRRHVGAEALAAFRDGALRSRKATRTSAHLAACSRCAALSDDLADVTAMLAGTHAPPMPEHLTARIQAALATEAKNRAAQPDAADRVAPSPRPPRLAPPRLAPLRLTLPRPASRIALRTMAATATAVLLVVGGYELAQSGGAAPAASGSASKGALGPESAPEASASGPVLRYQHADHAESVTAIASGTDFAAASLRHQVAAELASHRAPAVNALTPGGPMSSAPSERAGPNTRMGSFGNLSLAVLQGCVSRIAAGSLVLLVDVAHYQGAPATVIVTQAAPGSPKQVSVVGAGCSATRSDLLAHATLAAGG
jgi:hypothetical protein